MLTGGLVALGVSLLYFALRRGRLKKLVTDETPLTVDALQERIDFARASGKTITAGRALEQVLEEAREVKKAKARMPK